MWKASTTSAVSAKGRTQSCARRTASRRHAKEAGLKVFTCCEPIGPEHTVDELVDSVFLAIDLGLDINAAMPRVAVPGSPMAHLGTISQERLAHIVACITLAFCNVGHPFMMVHEPSLPASGVRRQPHHGRVRL